MEETRMRVWSPYPNRNQDSFNCPYFQYINYLILIQSSRPCVNGRTRYFQVAWLQPMSIFTHSSTTFNFTTLHRVIQPCLAAEKYSLNQYQLILKMSSSADKEEKMDQARKCNSKEANEFNSAKRISDDIIPHLLNLYGSRATPRDFAIYAPHASFEDPLMYANGVKEIKSAFYSLSKVFSESRIVEYSVNENIVSPSKGEILIDNKQRYKFWGKDIDLISLIKLYIEDGKVVRHEDWWDKKPLWNRETIKVPLVGRIMEISRRGSMLLTHVMMGFGNDPTK